MWCVRLRNAMSENGRGKTCPGHNASSGKPIFWIPLAAMAVRSIADRVINLDGDFSWSILNIKWVRTGEVPFVRNASLRTSVEKRQ